ncbi:MAG: hypothetical protein LQ337_001670, partial [Flavoplaca oasis]
GALVDGGPLALVEAGFEAIVLLGDVADIFDEAKVDGVGLQALSATIAGKGVKEGISGGVVRLTFVADDA